MALWETFNSAESAESYTRREELKYVPRQWVDQWVKQKSGMLQNLNATAGTRVLAVRKKILKALSDGGVSILFGTDSPQVFSVPGFSIHREIPILIEAGLSPYQVLASGTSNVARYLGAKNAGTVEAGKSADLILLEANPLENIANLSKRAGVMVRGKWLPESELQSKLHALARKYGQ
jgi:imidazolonepropionase-like amidohydrolase